MKPMSTLQDAAHHDVELQEWLESFEAVLALQGKARSQYILSRLEAYAGLRGAPSPSQLQTAYMNSITPDEEVAYPGDLELEQRITNIHRWNSIAMVLRANAKEPGIGGHLSTYASAADLYEVGFQHFFRGKTAGFDSDAIYFQGHASPGIYARAFLEGRLSERQLDNFRREKANGGGLSSYPHPFLMPDFWEFPTVSMGLGPLCAIYQARFLKYLENRELKPQSSAKVWAFLGDGEMDEVESLGALGVASRENLDNLIFVVNCNLQRLDGPVRGNGKIVQELERVFRGAGWNVLKLLWGRDWDSIFEKDTQGALTERLGELLDGQFQRHTILSGEDIRKDLVHGDPRREEVLKHLSDAQVRQLRRGGHDPYKIYQAYHRATTTKGQPTVILVKTIKGYGMGDAGEGRNIAHQQKKMAVAQLLALRDRFEIPLTNAQVESFSYLRPDPSSPEMQYLHERRKALGGPVPNRRVMVPALVTPGDETFKEFFEGTKDKEVSTTMALVRMIAALLKKPDLGQWIVPIVPDESRTFGMEALFNQIGIYSPVGQLYDPIDKGSVLVYKESKKGQLLQEGINEAGSMASFMAAGTAYASQGLPIIPMYIYYSMFGFQRVGDLAWAAADQQCRGFLFGGTAGRTTLSGEGLQHQDGHSHLLAYPIPTLRTYDPAFAFEIAVILKDGLRRMYQEQENVFYYVTVGNENYVQPPMPQGAEEGILKGMYLFRPSTLAIAKARVQLMGMGAILNEVLKAQKLLEEEFQIQADVWSVTSFKQLREEALDCTHWNLHHASEPARVPYITQLLKGTSSICVAATDYVKMLPDSVSKWIPLPLYTLGTDGFGLSEGRASLRDHFEVDAKHIAYTAIYGLAQQGLLTQEEVQRARDAMGIPLDPSNPHQRIAL